MTRQTTPDSESSTDWEVSPRGLRIPRARTAFPFPEETNPRQETPAAVMSGSSGVGSGGGGGNSQAAVPRIGGGVDSDTFWTGGSNDPTKRLARPVSIHARRPEDFRSAEKIEYACTRGLDDAYKLGADEETEVKVTFTTWMKELHESLSRCGMDTVFYSYNPFSQDKKEINLFTDYRAASDLNGVVAPWCRQLDTDGTKDPTDQTKTLSVCEFDKQNLLWSATFIRNSITVSLFTSIEADARAVKTGPELLSIIVQKKQSVAASTTRDLINELQGMKLSNEVGKNVDDFCTKVTHTLTKLKGLNEAAIPFDISTMILTMFRDTGVSEFETKRASLYCDCEDNPTAHSPAEIMTALKKSYRTLLQAKPCLWTPAQNAKDSKHKLSAMTATLHKLNQKIDSLQQQQSSKSRKEAGDGILRGRDGKPIVCHTPGCGGNHYKRDCPKKSSGNSDTNSSNNGSGSGSSSGTSSTSGSSGGSKTLHWSKTPPTDGNEQMTRDGTEYLWCGKCKRWHKGKAAHRTADHKTKQQLKDTGLLTLAASADTVRTSNLSTHLPAMVPTPTPAPAPDPTLGPPVSTGLRMQSSLFVGVPQAACDDDSFQSAPEAEGPPSDHLNMHAGWMI